MNFKTLILAAAASLAGFAGHAATISGEIGIAGGIDTVDFTDENAIDVYFDGFHIVSTGSGDFAALAGTFVSMFDIVASSTGVVVSGNDGFSFTSTGYHSVDNDGTDGVIGFVASGFFDLNGSDTTGAFMHFSTQCLSGDNPCTSGESAISFSAQAAVPLPASSLLLLGGLGGLIAVRRRKKAA